MGTAATAKLAKLEMRIESLTDGTIHLRPPTEEDAEAIAASVQASVAELELWLPWATPTYTPNDALDWVRNKFDATAHSFLIVEADGSIAGSCGLNQVDSNNRRANLGYWVRSDLTSRGLATRATLLLAQYGHEDLGLQRLEIIMSVKNEPSRRVAERAGATFEGTQRKRLFLRGEYHDAHMFSLVTEN